MTRILRAVSVLALLLAGSLPALAQEPVTVEGPRTVLQGTPFSLDITLPDEAAETPVEIRSARGEVLQRTTLEGGTHTVEGLSLTSRADLPVAVVTPQGSAGHGARLLPGWLSLLPPLLAIAFALIFREVVISLFAGIWLGALILAGFDPLQATMRAVDTYLVGALTDGDHVAIVIFSLLLGGMVGVVTRSGGARGVVEALRPYATTRRRGQFFAWLSGLMLFFDDYANTLIRGNMLRPVTDQLRISREKLAYIVDSVAAPIAVTAFISTWIGFEIAMIRDSLAASAEQVVDPVMREGLLAGAANPFQVFLHSIPYLFYPILAILLVLFLVLQNRDFGPMWRAEVRAVRGEGLYREGAMLAGDPEGEITGPPEGAPLRWLNLVVPVGVVILVALAGLYYTGAQALPPGERAIRDVIGEADPFASLLWASFAGVVVAMGLAIAQRILTVVQAVEAWMGGMKAMLMAIVILLLAWGLSGLTDALGTGPYLAGALGEALPLAALPAIVFFIAAITAFATGTSWGTMAILFPVVVPLAVAMGAGVDFGGGQNYTILLGSISSIMAGAVFGDHCSPISDTTVLSSMASGCDHVDHVRTQLPYALVVAVIAIVIGEIPAALGMSPWIALAVGAVLLWVVVRFVGKPVPRLPEDARPVAPAAAGQAVP
jgi:Na+/H+ antiporter NhaC